MALGDPPLDALVVGDDGRDTSDPSAPPTDSPARLRGSHRSADPHRLKRITNEIAHHAHTVGVGQLDE
jgi:hypothetical protein